MQSLRVILGSLQAKGKERQWVKHQTFGDLDDTKLIEGSSSRSMSDYSNKNNFSLRD